jgi:hypothetical protein
MSYNPNFEQIGNSLVQVYYSKFDVPDGQTRATNLQDLYDPEASIMTFEGVQVRGRQAILEKFGVSYFNEKMLLIYFLGFAVPFDPACSYKNRFAASCRRFDCHFGFWTIEGNFLFFFILNVH